MRRSSDLAFVEREGLEFLAINEDEKNPQSSRQTIMLSA